MKKLFLLFATVTLLIGVQACKEKQTEETTTTVEEVTTDPIPDSTIVTVPAAVKDSKDIKIPPPSKNP